MSNKSIQAWTSIAMLALLAHFSGGSWLALLILVVIGYGVLELMPKNLGQLKQKRFISALQLIGIYLLISQLAPFTAQYWPGKIAEIVIPVTLGLLAIRSSGKRPERVAGILFWAMCILLIPIALAGIKDISPEWIIPQKISLSAWVVPALLLPILTEMATGEKQRRTWYLGTGLLGIGIWIIVNGVMSNKIAQTQQTPLRNMGQTLALGPYSRFEAIVSIVETLVWYGFLSLAVYCADQFWAVFKIKQRKSAWIHGVLLLTIGVIGAKIPPEITVVYIVFAWVVLPVFEMKKISKKSEKSS